MITKVEKRNGDVVDYDSNKINSAISKAMQSVDISNLALAHETSGLVQDYLFMLGQTQINIEQIQDMIEKVLMEEGYSKIAKSFILYRQKRKEIREAKSSTGVIDDCNLSLNAIKVLKERYLKKDESGKICESPKQMFERVAKYVASVEEKFGGDANEVALNFFNVMFNRNFLPNSPLLMNAGTENKQLSAIFCLPLKDTTESIFNTLKDAAIIHKSGGGVGFSFSNIRPRGDSAGGTIGASAGPLAFLSIFDRALEKVKQRGRRHGANMGVLRIDHPDILNFITCKESKDAINNFNLSVGITDAFVVALKNNEPYDLINPKNGKVVGQLGAKSTFDLLSTMAWKNGDPGIIFIDRINNKRSNPTPTFGRIENTSSCGEMPLLPNESVILGSINLSNHVKKSKLHPSHIDWEMLKETINTAVHFLDNATEINQFHLPETSDIVKKNRKIGLGIMGWADLLIKLRISYNSGAAVSLAREVTSFIDGHARDASKRLAQKRGVFANYDLSVYKYSEDFKVRNAVRTAISPTGTLSILASCSAGIEPLFALTYMRKTSQFEMLEVNPLFAEIAKEEGFYSDDLLRKIAQFGSIQSIEEIPEHIKEIFITAMDIPPETHVAMQAAFQSHLDGAVSKTVNFPYSATVEDVKKVFMLAYEKGCKGITIYRDGSRNMQVLTSFNREFVKEKNESGDERKLIIDDQASAPRKTIFHRKLDSFN
jgi:ribonucleoside-diphosphate reductase alpha chain